jgi:hypothetical protein
MDGACVTGERDVGKRLDRAEALGDGAELDPAVCDNDMGSTRLIS